MSTQRKSNLMSASGRMVHAVTLVVSASEMVANAVFGTLRTPSR